MRRPLLGLALIALSAAPGVAQAEGWPDLSKPPPRTGGGEGDAAVIVAVEKYADVPGVPGAQRNAQDWYEYLVRARGVPVSNVTLLRDREGTVEKIRKFAAQAAAAVKPGATLWFVFVGHGAPAKDGRDGVLVGYDAQQDADSLYARSLPLGELVATLEQGGQARAVVVVDACFSGRSPGGGALVQGLQPLIPVSAHARQAARSLVLTAGEADQFAGPLPGEQRPAFSYLLLGALRGWGDADGDGTVTGTEAVEYSRGALQALLKDRSQRPQATGPAGVALATGAKEKGPDLAALVLRPPASAPPAAAPSAAGDDLELTAHLLCRRKLPGGKFEPIADCTQAALSAGDEMKIGFEVSRPAYLYLVNRNDKEQLQMLFPGVGEANELSPGSVTFIPPEGEWFETDAEVKDVTEHLRITVAAKPLPDLEGLRGLDQPPRDWQGRGFSRKPPPPPATSPRTFDLPGGRFPGVSAKVSGQGVVSTEFRIVHK